jgi:hypothetical protein
MAACLVWKLRFVIPALQFDTFDQLFAALPYLQMDLAFAILQQRLHRVDPITDWWVGLW